MSNHTSISPEETADRVAIRELVEAYAHCADRRDAKGTQESALYPPEWVTRERTEMHGCPSEQGKKRRTSKMHDIHRGVPDPLTERTEPREEVLRSVDVSKGALSATCAHLLTDDLIHQLVHTELHIRMEERANERTRIARDLHDTLLQSFQGVLLKLSAVCYVIRNRPADAAGMVERIVEQARQAVTEGRDAVLGLRSSAVVTNDLAKAITTFGAGLSSDQPGGKSPYFRVDVEGSSMDIAPLIRDEAYRIVGEALRNAFRHADARRIEVKIHYEEPRLRIMVQDDGRGIDAQFLNVGGRTGHHGLPGMYERAQLAGGKLIVWSELDSGTHIELSIPASVAYTKAPVLRMSAAFGQGTG